MSALITPPSLTSSSLLIERIVLAENFTGVFLGFLANLGVCEANVREDYRIYADCTHY